MNNKLFMRWWILLMLMIFGACVSWYFGFYQFIWDKDFTKISFLIIALFIANTISIGYKTYNYKTKRRFNEYKMEWFFSDSVISLGMVGTIIGFIYMLFSVFVSIDVSNSEKMTEVLAEMSVGMSTALLTTLVGLISSIFLKLQLMIAESKIE
ncbi:MAG TPA: hypothetical protein DCM40_22420 [Maribacter sp.]|nr:hypothetical protein [Maribacter sp.]